MFHLSDHILLTCFQSRGLLRQSILMAHMRFFWLQFIYTLRIFLASFWKQDGCPRHFLMFPMFVFSWFLRDIKVFPSSKDEYFIIMFDQIPCLYNTKNKNFFSWQVKVLVFRSTSQLFDKPLHSGMRKWKIMQP